MPQTNHKDAKDLRELRRERGLLQGHLGGVWTVVQVEAGRRLPGPTLLSKWAAKLDLPAPTVMAACRESQRRALVARGRSAQVVGSHRRRSCPKRSPRRAAEVQQ